MTPAISSALRPPGPLGSLAARPVRQSYWAASRSPRYSYLLALPLLVLYEALAAVLNYGSTGGVRNGADVILKSFFIAIAGRYGPLLFAVCLLGAGLFAVARDRKRNGADLRPAVLGAMIGESVLYGLLFGVVVGGLTSRLLGPLARMSIGGVDDLGGMTAFMVSLGAGLYEELVFRVLLVGALVYIGRRLFKWRPWPAGIVAAVVGAFIFSAFHYIGPMGDELQLGSFVFRWIGGLAFSLLYVTRGFGIAAWSHALYDVFLLVL